MYSDIQVGKACVYIGDSQDGNHSVEQLADMLMDRLISVSGDAPQPIKDQLFAFRARARLLFIEYLTKAQKIERSRANDIISKEWGVRPLT